MNSFPNRAQFFNAFMGFGWILADTFPIMIVKSGARSPWRSSVSKKKSSETQCHTFQEEHCEANVYILLILTPIGIELCYIFLLIFCTELLFTDFRSSKFIDK